MDELTFEQELASLAAAERARAWAASAIPPILDRLFRELWAASALNPAVAHDQKLADAAGKAFDDAINAAWNEGADFTSHDLHQQAHAQGYDGTKLFGLAPPPSNPD